MRLLERVGFSFGYNRNEGDEHHLPIDALIHLFVDIVAKNGNLLLNIGPMADGTIPELQMRRLDGLGDWLATNGEAIFDTRPWHVADGATAEGIGVRYTQRTTRSSRLCLARRPQARPHSKAYASHPEHVFGCWDLRERSPGSSRTTRCASHCPPRWDTRPPTRLLSRRSRR